MIMYKYTHKYTYLHRTKNELSHAFSVSVTKSTGNCKKYLMENFISHFKSRWNDYKSVVRKGESENKENVKKSLVD